jgi:hypothetical protein
MVVSCPLFYFVILIFPDHLLSDNSDDQAISRWRTMTVDAVFQMNDGIEAVFNEQLVSTIGKLENSLRAAFPDYMLTRNINFIGEIEHQLVNIVKQARELSFELQHYVSGRFIVTLHRSNNGLSTCAFGLEGPSGRVLLEAKAIDFFLA